MARLTRQASKKALIDSIQVVFRFLLSLLGEIAWML